MPDAAKSKLQGFFELGMRANNNPRKEHLPGPTSLHAAHKARTDYNQLQDQAFDLR